MVKNKNDKSLFVETCRILLCYRDEKDFFDILRITALKLTKSNMAYSKNCTYKPWG